MREKLELLERACAVRETADDVQVPRLPRVESLEDAMLRAARDVVRRTTTVVMTWHALTLRSSGGCRCKFVP